MVLGVFFFYRATKVRVNAQFDWVMILLDHGNANWGLSIQLELLLLTSLAEPGYPLSYNQSHLDFTTYTKYFSCIM